MSNGFSIDDILNEVDKKRVQSTEKKLNMGITEILEMPAATKTAEEKPREFPRPDVTERNIRSTPSSEPELPVISDKPVKPKKHRKLDKTEDIVTFRKAKVLPKPIIEDEFVPEPEPYEISTETFDFPAISETQILGTAEGGIAAGGSPDPLEALDELNPYDVLPAPYIETNEETGEQFISMLSGDTIGIADGDLKELAGLNRDNSADAATAEVVKTFIPNTPASDIAATRVDVGVVPEDEGEEKDSHLSEKDKRSNTALIDSLNKALKDKRASDVEAYRNTGSMEINKGEVNEEGQLTFGLNIDYKKQILDTSLSLAEQKPQLIEHKINELAGKRKRKIRDFVLEDIEEGQSTEYYEEDEIETEEDDCDTASRILSDLEDTHKGLKIRFIILLVLTVFNVIVAVGNDLKIMNANVFGIDMRFLDIRFDVNGLLYLHLICGMLGILTCAPVIRRGISQLFSGKADCDSLCAVPAVVSVLCIIPMLSGTGFYQLGYSNTFVAVGLCGLLFNTIGKLMMMARAKRNFKFTSGDNPKYYAEIIEDEQISRAFTKGVLYEIPVLCGMRKTEYLSDFLKNSYTNDKADQLCRFLVPAALGAAIVVGVGALFMPYESIQATSDWKGFWALTAAQATLCLLSPLSIMFLVNNPLLRASKALEKEEAVVLGYNSAEKFAKVNSVLVDASALFPAGSVDFRNLKRCQHPNSLDNFAIDDAIITAASLAIKSGSILTSMFYDMIAGKQELLYEIDNCIYEVNMGITGWMGNKRVMLGNRDQMKHHGIRVPDLKKEQKYSDKFGDVVYLAAKGETIAMFFLKIVPNPQIKTAIQNLQKQGVSVIVRSRDSLITDKSLAEAFDLNPEHLKVIPYDLHSVFDECTRYASRGSGDVACAGRFTSFAGALGAAKKIMHSIILSSSALFSGLFFGIILAVIFTIFFTIVDGTNTNMFSSTNIILFNLFFFGAMMLMQGVKKY